MAVSLGLDESDSTKSTLEVYKQYFEEPFLKATSQYYLQESKQFLAENSVVEYMKRVCSSLKCVDLNKTDRLGRPSLVWKRKKTGLGCIFLKTSVDL